MSHNFNTQRGFSLVEILITIGLAAILLPVFLTSMVSIRDSRPYREKRLRASNFMQECIDAVYLAKEEGWSNVATVGTYYPTITSNTWQLAAGSQTIDDFTREIVIEDVYRNSNLDIVTSGGILDKSTKKVTVNVDWTLPNNGQVTSTFYLTRYANNTSWTQTTDNSFSSGSGTGIVYTAVGDGEVQLATGTATSWANPANVGTFSGDGTGDGKKFTIIGNYGYLTQETTSGHEFTIIDATNPIALTKISGVEIGNIVYDMVIDGNYAYLATGVNNAELTIINITNKNAPTIVGTRDLGNNNDAFAIAKSGNFVYVAKDSSGGSAEMYVVNVTNPALPLEVGSYENGADVNDIKIEGNYAYLATDNLETVILNITVPAAPTLAGFYDSAGGANGESIVVSGSYAYLGLASGTGNDFEIVNISNQASPTLVGGYDVGGTVTGINIIGNYAFLSTSNGSAEFTALNISNLASPSLVGTFNLDTSDDIFVQGNYAYMVNNNSNEILILEGGTSGGLYETYGEYTSDRRNANATVTWNYIDFIYQEPAGTDFKLQVGLSTDDVTYTYVGPDGTSATYYEDPGHIPLNVNEARYFKIKAFFYGDGTATPVLEYFSVNYLP
ncbi:MAG: prepilin-type N-terminal cleavage/methylation domain-containing protein [Patescibacteria group bacterium]